MEQGLPGAQGWHTRVIFAQEMRVGSYQTLLAFS